MPVSAASRARALTLAVVYAHMEVKTWSVEQWNMMSSGLGASQLEAGAALAASRLCGAGRQKWRRRRAPCSILVAQ